MAMTAPVLTTDDEKNMSFLMPFEHQNVDSLPQPTENRVKLNHVPESVVAAVEFSGSAETCRQTCREHFFELRKFLKENGLLEDDYSDEKAMQE